jgi:hypothetical protein
VKEVHELFQKYEAPFFVRVQSMTNTRICKYLFQVCRETKYFKGLYIEKSVNPLALQFDAFDADTLDFFEMEQKLSIGELHTVLKQLVSSRSLKRFSLKIDLWPAHYPFDHSEIKRLAAFNVVLLQYTLCVSNCLNCDCFIQSIICDALDKVCFNNRLLKQKLVFLKGPCVTLLSQKVGHDVAKIIIRMALSLINKNQKKRHDL